MRCVDLFRAPVSSLMRILSLLLILALVVVVPSPKSASALECVLWHSGYNLGYCSHNVWHGESSTSCTNGIFAHGNAYGVVGYSKGVFNYSSTCTSIVVGLTACVPNTYNCVQGSMLFNAPGIQSQVQAPAGFLVLKSAFRWASQCENYNAL